MKNIILLFAITTILCQCSPKIVPIKNTYQDKPFTGVSDNNKDTVWDKIVDFFAQNGLSIRIIDRSSGLIVSNITALTWTHENAKGGLIDPAAWVVLNKVYYQGSTKYVLPVSVTGEWNIRIKSIADNKTNINVNLVNLKYNSPTDQPTVVIKDKKYIPLFQTKSTGKFEEKIFDIVK